MGTGTRLSCFTKILFIFTSMTFFIFLCHRATHVGALVLAGSSKVYLLSLVQGNVVMVESKLYQKKGKIFNERQCSVAYFA